MRHTFLLVIVLCVGPALAGRWLVRDVAADSDWTERPETIGLRVEAAGEAATVLDTSGSDRAVTLAYVLPLDATGWTWHDDPQTSRPIRSSTTKPFIHATETQCGATGTASLYPLAVVSREGHAVVLGVPPEPARMVRLVYDPVRRELRAEFDFGLSAVPARFPARADARVLTYELTSRWPFRAAMEKYWGLFPASFARRPNTPAGIWLPFNDIRGIKDPTDFGIQAHECADSQVQGPDSTPLLAADAAAGCQSFPYVEPPTYWQQYAGDKSAGYAERLAQLEKEAAGGSLIAQSTLVSGILTAGGKRDLYLGKVAYTTQAPWGSDPNPDIPANAQGWPSKGRYETDRLLSYFRDHPGLRGVYIDSMEGWGTILNYNQEHWKVSRFPLTFDPATKKVCLWNFWGTYSFVSSLADTLHAEHKLLMANDAYFRFWFAFPYVDVPGREYTWTDAKGNLTPVGDERYLFFKSMAGRRPYLMLMNNKYEDASIMEPYFQRSLFYATYPSMFQGHTAMGETAYFSNPAWYERDRPLFRKYLPLIRQLDLAGWQPVPHATASTDAIRVERYGSFDDHTLAYTLYNPSDVDERFTLTLDVSALHLPAKLSATERIAARAVTVESNRINLMLPAHAYADVGVE